MRCADPNFMSARSKSVVLIVTQGMKTRLSGSGIGDECGRIKQTSQDFSTGKIRETADSLFTCVKRRS
jgi:hypothetical protein